MNEQSDFLLDILNDLNQIHNLFLEQKDYQAGFYVCYLINSLKDKLFNQENQQEGEYGQKEIQEQKESNAEFEKILYEKHEKISGLILRCQETELYIQMLDSLIRGLLKKDHIYADSIDHVIRVIKKEDETIDDLYSLLPGNRIRVEKGTL